MTSRKASALVWALALCGGSAVAAQGADFGRLFSTPAERTQLERLRQGGQAAPAEPVESGASQTTSASPRVVVKGIVMRSDGKSAAWVNDSNTLPKGSSAGGSALTAGVGKDGRVRLSVDGSPVVLKPGQVFDPASGLTHELYQAPAKTAAPVVAPAATEAGS